MSDQQTERTTMMKAAVAACFAAHEPVTPANVRKNLPEDFFVDFDSGEPLDDQTVFDEIQSVYASAPKQPMQISDNEVVEDFSGDTGDETETELAPERVLVPDVEPRPLAVEGGLPLPPQARLDAAHEREKVLLAARPILQANQKQARADLAASVMAYQRSGPQQTHEDLARDFIAASQREREARVNGEAWAIKPERRANGTVAYVDLERSYSQGGDANTFARRTMAGNGNRRGAYSKSSLGHTNRDPSRGAVPKPVEPPRPTVPALAK